MYMSLSHNFKSGKLLLECFSSSGYAANVACLIKIKRLSSVHQD